MYAPQGFPNTSPWMRRPPALCPDGRQPTAPWNWAGGWEQALTLFPRQALEGSLHHAVTGPSLAPPQKKGAVFDPDSFLLPETFQHPVVKFTSFLWER